MANVYFAKFNINDEIYEVYADNSLREKILHKIYQGLNTKFSIQDNEGTYKFITLDKNADNYLINGRIVHYGPGTHVTYDPDKDDVTESLDDKKASYVTFSFDVKNEIIGFVPKRDFGFKQFIKRFKSLVEKSAEVGEIQIFLETDTELLTERLKNLERVSEITVRLIPPNDDREDFRALFGTDAEDIEDSGATRFFIRLFTSSKRTIKVSSKYVQKLIRAIGLGYGYMFVSGYNKSGEKVTLKSEEDTPYTRPIHPNSKDSIPGIMEKTRAGITELKALKVTRRVTNSNEES